LAVLNARAGTLGLKIVYVGAAFGGKTTNLKHLHRTLPPDRRGRLTSLAGDGERTLFFDFMAFELGVVAGLKTHFHLYTVPGQPELMASRRAVLRGADALVCVVDSQAARLDENRHALADVDARKFRVEGDIEMMLAGKAGFLDPAQGLAPVHQISVLYEIPRPRLFAGI